MNLEEKVRNAGVVGAGGAGFPTHVKLASKAEYVIMNGAECEPLLKVDQQLMNDYTCDIVNGFKKVMATVDAKKGFIGIKKKHKEAIESLKTCIDSDKDASNIEVFILEDFYPAGDEQVLVYEVLKRIVPEASIPLKVGCVVVNSETVLNIEKADAGFPVVDTYLTITGRVPSPITLKLPIGTKVSEALAFSGLKNFDGIKVIDGGPMMGKILENVDGPITKATKGLIVLPEDHNLIKKKTMPLDRARRIARVSCEQCRMCTDLCPRFLIGHNMQPHKMMRKVSYQYGDLKDAEIALLCCECNLCELYACPVGITPKSINVLYKGLLAKDGIKYSTDKTNFEARSTREYRKVPVKRLIQKLGLAEFNKDAPFDPMEYSPSSVCIPLKQHAGAPAQSVVSVGQMVKRGDLIGEIPENSLGARVHASIDGKVVSINENIIIERM